MKFDNNVFIHIPKNLGTTIETVILKNYYKFDIKDDELPNEKNSSIWYNYWNSKYQIKDIFFKQEFKSKHTQPISVYLNSFKEIVNLFTIVRNPYDRIISLYYDTINRKEHYGIHHSYNESFDHFIKSEYFKNNKLLPHYSKRQIDFIDVDNTNIKILKFEEKDKIIEYFNTIGIKLTHLPHINSTLQKDKIDITPYLDKINDYYYDDFIKFNYIIRKK